MSTATSNKQDQITDLNPNVSGNSLKSFFNNVDFPDPEGPQITNGRGPCFTMTVE